METPNLVHAKLLKWLRIAFFAMPFLAVVDVLLPSLFKNIINKQLAKQLVYKGQIGSIGVSFINRRIVITKIIIDKINTETQKNNMFTSVQRLVISYSWTALWHKQLVLDVKAVNASVFFNRNRLMRLQKVKADLNIPLTINSVIVDNACFQYIDTGVTPTTNIMVNKIMVDIHNLDNKPLKDATYLISTKADVCNGKLDSIITVKPGHINPTFDMDIKLTGVQLTKLNSFFMAYAKFDVNKGIFDLFIEAKADFGKFYGYIKPIITGLDVFGPEDRNVSIGNKIWQGIIEFITNIFENQKHDSIATKIPFDGTFQNPEVNVTYAVIEVFFNAFVKAITPAFDYNFDSLFRKRA